MLRRILFNLSRRARLLEVNNSLLKVKCTLRRQDQPVQHVLNHTRLCLLTMTLRRHTIHFPNQHPSPTPSHSSFPYPQCNQVSRNRTPSPAGINLRIVLQACILNQHMQIALDRLHISCRTQATVWDRFTCHRICHHNFHTPVVSRPIHPDHTEDRNLSWQILIHSSLPL